MIGPSRRTIRIPHWGWCAVAAVLVFGLCVLLAFGIPAYRRYQIISHFRAKGCMVTYYGEPDWREPAWSELLPAWCGENLKSTLYPHVWVYGETYEIADADLPQLARLTSLAWLRLTRRVTDAGLVHLVGLDNLRELEFIDSEITDSGLPLLLCLPKIEHLDLRGTKVTDAGLNHLRRMPSLRDLYIDSDFGVGFTDAGLANIAVLKNLDSLAFEGDLFTDNGIAEISRMTNLQSLSVGGDNITDKGIAEIARMTNLRHLQLGPLSITDTGLAELGKLTDLKSLYLHYTRRVTAAGIAKLRAALPKCEITSQGPVAESSAD